MSRLGGTSSSPSTSRLGPRAIPQSSSPAAVGLGSRSFAVERDRAGRPVVGYAADRPQRDVRLIYYPFVGPWGRWYPWYSSGFGWGGFGYLAYDPFYSSYYYRYPYGYPYNIYNRPTSPSIYGSSYSSGEPEELAGSIRFRAEPKEALVYINGALVGTIDDFNGLSDHLRLPAGVHQLEIRADGYETYVAELTVEAGKTLTERFSLKKRQ